MADEQRKCSRCESGKPAKTYDPRTPGHLDKTVDLCDDCAAKDPKVVLLDNEVPKIEPAVPTPANEPEKPDIIEFATEEHGPKIPDPISIPTPKSVPPTVPVEEKPVSTEPIARQEIRDKLAKHEEQLNQLLESRQRILAQIPQKSLAQLNQVNTLMDVKKVAIAALRDILGNEER